MYRVGTFGWTLAARLGVPLLLRVEVMQDKEVGAFIATSKDLIGLVVEAKTLDDLSRQVFECANMLIAERIKTTPKRRTSIAWDGALTPA